MDASRDETDAERSDRNWLELIQELRVAQTGVQVLAGFLLTLPFTAHFGVIGTGHRTVYLVAFSLAVLTVGLMTAPVALHRLLFAHHKKDVLVRIGGLCAKSGLATMGLTLVVAVVLIFGVVLNDLAGILAGTVVLLVYLLLWLVLPLSLMHLKADS